MTRVSTGWRRRRLVERGVVTGVEYGVVVDILLGEDVSETACGKRYLNAYSMFQTRNRFHSADTHTHDPILFLPSLRSFHPLCKCAYNASPLSLRIFSGKYRSHAARDTSASRRFQIPNLSPSRLRINVGGGGADGDGGGDGKVKIGPVATTAGGVGDMDGGGDGGGGGAAGGSGGGSGKSVPISKLAPAAAAALATYVGSSEQ